MTDLSYSLSNFPCEIEVSYFDTILRTMVTEKYAYVGKVMNSVFVFQDKMNVFFSFLKVSGCSRIQNLKGIVKDKHYKDAERCSKFVEKIL